jgi:type VI secretion system protein ImpB
MSYPIKPDDHLPAARVDIHYEVEVDGSKEERRLPFVTGIMGDFIGNNSDYNVAVMQRVFYTVDETGVDGAFAHFRPGLKFSVKNVLDNNQEKLSLSLKFQSMADFEPPAIVEQVPELLALKQRKEQLRAWLNELEMHPEREDEIAKKFSLWQQECFDVE